ncbi:MAG: DUF2974 domain-containing protein [Clostridiales bacterium]|nr:DUF2974 domain-containing protein [Clostridiales bacterium]
MTDIFDYLFWRGDLPLDRIPMNEVDGMVAARIAYLPFETVDVLRGDTTVADAAQALLAANDATDSIRQKNDIPLLRALCDSARFGSIRIADFEHTTDTVSQTQFAALTLLLPDGSICIAFRGTDNTLVGWKEDFNMSFVCPVAGQTLAVHYLERAAEKYANCKITLLGHSKGGNFAVYAAAFCAEETQARIQAVYNYDGPGFDEKVLSADGYKAICGRVSTFVPQSSVVGMLLEHEEAYTIVHSEQVGILQHDLFSWEVCRDTFAHLETVDNSSRFVNYTLKSWLAAMDYSQRETFADAVYTILTETNASTLRELSASWFESAKSVATSLKNLDEPTRKALTQALSLLARSAKTGLSQVMESK